MHAADPSRPATDACRRRVLVLALCLLLPILPFALIGELPGERWLSNAGDGALAFGATGAAILASDTLLPVPSSLVGALLGARLGALSGGLWAFAGLVAGSLVAFATGRVLRPRLSTDLDGAPALLALLASRPVPVLAEAMAIACGTSRMGLAPFLAAASAGNAIYAGLLAASGAALVPEGFAGPGLAVPLGTPVVGWIVWRRVAARRPEPAPGSGAR
jgi:membrane protein DedA with SNARE-associated domain